MVTTINFDNIIYKLQKNGGASLYWKELVSRVARNAEFKVDFTCGSRYNRLLPVISNSDIFHSSHFRTSCNRKSKIVSTIHDFTYERGLVSGSKIGKEVNIWQRRNAIKLADSIICISENTKKEMLDIYPDSTDKEIHVIYHGCSFGREIIINVQVTRRLAAFESELNKFVLYVGTRNSYKNFNSALIGFSMSSLAKNDFTFVCTGSNFTEEEAFLIQKLGVDKKVLIFDYATHDELSYLYQNAFALVYPSIYEGFGLPPLEAMNSGSPVIAANSSSIPEVVSDAGILIDNIEDYEAIKNALETLLDEQIRNTYIVKGLNRAKLFTWESSVNQHVKVYQKLAEL
jgi:glycosyltransferase involved in cell wall biosynthesis